MSIEFFSKLSQNYIELLKDDEYYDITIEVGEEPNVKTFRAHMNILCHRSPYLRQILAFNKKNDGSLSNIELPNISPDIFQIILKYIYGGILLLNEQEPSDILNVLVAADVLCLQELVEYLQKYLIENKSEWMKENFESTLRISSQSNNLLELQQFCTNLMTRSPEKIFESSDFTSLPEKILISLIKRDDLRMKEIEIWEHVLRWGLAKNSTLISDPNIWSDGDFKAMEITLQHCLPLIRFFNLSTNEFLQKVHPYKRLLKRKLYGDLLNSYLNIDSKPPLTSKIIDIDSKIINSNIVSIISRWIDKMVIEFNEFDDFRELYLPYKFKLLLRGSRDGFTPKKFHELCDNKPKTVTIIKVKGTEEILGGYNPIIWKTSVTPDSWWCAWGETKDSFIFSFKNNNNFEDVIISNIEDTNNALVYHHNSGPYFGICDIVMQASNESEDYDLSYCKKCKYEKRIRDTEEKFSIEDYEVFQIEKR